jgi:alpha-beta hydrolase superfamily lysophospholipase
MARLRDVSPVPPSETGEHAGLAYALWVPEGASAGVVILHGAGSAKESHLDFARLLAGAGLGALVFDARGHGASDGPMDGRPGADIVAVCDLLRSRLGGSDAPIGLRGSSMGGYLALVAAGPAEARAVVAICPASADGLRRGLRAGRFGFAADTAALDAFLVEHDLETAVESLDAPVLLLHAEGDEVVPVEHSRTLASHLRHPDSRLIAVPGGHHRSVQHDSELQALSLRFISQAFAPPG